MLGRSPSQRVGVPKVSWNMRPRSGFADISLAEGRDLLVQLIEAIDTFVVQLPIVQAQIAALKAQGKQTDFLEKKLKIWAAQAQRGLDLFASWIEQSTGLQSIIDNMAGQQTTPGLSEIRIGAWKEFISELKPAVPATQAGLGFVAIVTAFGRALLNPAVWSGVKNVLLVIVPLAASVAPWIFGAKISENIKQTVRGSEEAKELLEKCLAALANANTEAEKAAVKKLCADAQDSNGFTWLLVGGAVGIGALFYLQSKISPSRPAQLSEFHREVRKNKVQSRSAALSSKPRKRRRR